MRAVGGEQSGNDLRVVDNRPAIRVEPFDGSFFNCGLCEGSQALLFLASHISSELVFFKQVCIFSIARGE